MAKKKTEQNLYLLSIVAIVAIVGIVILILNAGGGVYVSESDLSGEAYGAPGFYGRTVAACQSLRYPCSGIWVYDMSTSTCTCVVDSSGDTPEVESATGISPCCCWDSSGNCECRMSDCNMCILAGSC